MYLRHVFFLLCLIHFDFINKEYKNESFNCDYVPNCFTTYAAPQLTQDNYFTSYFRRSLNPYPANVDNMVSSYQCLQMADGI
jgi:hypothetical protein